MIVSVWWSIIDIKKHFTRVALRVALWFWAFLNWLNMDSLFLIKDNLWLNLWWRTIVLSYCRRVDDDIKSKVSHYSCSQSLDKYHISLSLAVTKTFFNFIWRQPVYKFFIVFMCLCFDVLYVVLCIVFYMCFIFYVLFLLICIVSYASIHTYWGLSGHFLSTVR